jgi:O-antigen ligase
MADTAAPHRAAPPALAVLCAGVVLCTLAFLPHAGPRLPDDYMVPRELVLHATALAAAVLCLARAGRVRLGADDLLLAGFALLGVLAYGGAANPWLATRAIGLTVSGVAVFWCARALAREGWGPALTRTAALAAAVLAATALLEAYGGVSLSLPGRTPGGVLGHRNSAAHLMVLALPLMVLHAAGARRTVLSLVPVAMAAAVVVLSRSRGAWLAALLLCACALALFLAQRRGRRALATRQTGRVALALAIGVAGAVLLPNRLGWRSGAPEAETLRTLADYSSGTGRGRVIQYVRTMGMIGDHPLLGVGPGNWTIEYPRYAAPRDPSHRPGELVPTARLPQGDWIGLAAERGVPALLLLALAGAVLALRSLRMLRAEGAGGDGGGEEDAARGCARAALGVLAALACLGTLDPVLLQPLHAFFVFLVLGALVPPGRERTSIGLHRPVPRRVAMAAVVLLAAGPLVVSARQLRAATVLARGADPARMALALHANPGDYRLQALMADHWIRRRRCDLALPHIRAARDLFPTAGAPRAMHAHCASAPPPAASAGAGARRLF